MRSYVRLVTFTAATIVTGWASQAFSQGPPPQRLDGLNDTASPWIIRFDTSPIDRLVFRADEVLEDVGAFWQDDPAYHLVRSWHTWNDIAIPMRNWKARIQAYADMPVNDRERCDAALMAGKLFEQKEEFLRKAVPHIRSYLPDTPAGITTNVFFTAETYPRAIGVGDNIVIDVTNDYWQGSDSTILNTAVHELFHVGYGWNVCAQTETPLANAALYAHLSTLQNEGLATYVAFRAQHLFPAPADQDYVQLDKHSAVRRACKLVNRLFRKAESRSAEKLRKEGWRIGVEQRAFYVLGAHMARTVDEKLGREALAGTVASGPLSYVDAYNGSAEEDMRIVEFEGPDRPSWPQRVRLAAAGRDYEAVRRLLATYAQQNSNMVPGVEDPFICTGKLLLRQRQYDLATDVLDLATRLFPSCAAGHYLLGEACSKRGDADRAVACYRRTLELEPGHLYAPARLETLRNIRGSDDK
jgi:tetratricopeptide (TPR) repeat protein